jgi:purine nucleoside permease
MAAIFSVRPGAIIALDDPSIVGDVRSLLKISPDPGFDLGRVLVTSVGFNEATEHQFSTSLADMIYVFSFGDQMGDFIISGIASTDSCDANGGSAGLKQVLDFYKSNRLTRRKTPLSIVLAAGSAVIAYEAYLIGHRTGSHSEGPQTRVFQFSLNLALVPDDLAG